MRNACAVVLAVAVVLNSATPLNLLSVRTLLACAASSVTSDWMLARSAVE
jgi:hypothetical protein